MGFQNLVMARDGKINELEDKVEDLGVVALW